VIVEAFDALQLEPIGIMVPLAALPLACLIIKSPQRQQHVSVSQPG